MGDAYLFIDGGYFRTTCEQVARNVFQVDDIPLSWDRLACGFQKIFYYDCPIPLRTGETEEAHRQRRQQQVQRLNAIRRQSGYHVFEGTTSGVGARARQKQIDVRIAVDMLMHAYRKNLTHATLLAGDLDFKPVVDALVELGIDVTLWSHHSSVSVELLGAADRQRGFHAKELHGLAHPDHQRLYPLPEMGSRSGRHINNMTLNKTGTLSDGTAVELFSGEGGFVLLHKDHLNAGHFIHSVHSDAKFLERVYEDVYGAVRWNDTLTPATP